MDLWQHFTVSAIIAIILYPFFGIDSLFIFMTGFLIDIDHIIYYLFRFKSIDLVKTYKYYKGISTEEYKKVIRIFHNKELIALLAILSFFNKIFLILLIGLIVHIMMDIIDEKKKFGKLYNFSILKALKQKAL